MAPEKISFYVGNKFTVDVEMKGAYNEKSNCFLFVY